jgi:hypothetical protein
MRRKKIFACCRQNNLNIIHGLKRYFQNVAIFADSFERSNRRRLSRHAIVFTYDAVQLDEDSLAELGQYFSEKYHEYRHFLDNNSA